MTIPQNTTVALDIHVNALARVRTIARLAIQIEHQAQSKVSPGALKRNYAELKRLVAEVKAFYDESQALVFPYSDQPDFQQDDTEAIYMLGKRAESFRKLAKTAIMDAVAAELDA